MTSVSDALSDYWATKYVGWKADLEKWWGGAAIAIPTGFGPGGSAYSWSVILASKFQNRIARLDATQDPIDAYYAENTQQALDAWHAMGGPKRDSAFLQTRDALDALIMDGAGIDAVVSLQREIRRWLEVENQGQDVPFPMPPPFLSRAKLDNYSPMEFARYVALQVVILPFADHPPVEDADLGLAGDALSREAKNASIIEALAGYTMTQETASARPSLGALRGVLDGVKAYLKTPDMAPLRRGIKPYLETLDAQIAAMETPLDRIADAPAELQREKEKVAMELRTVGEAAVAGVALLGTLAFFLGRSAKNAGQHLATAPVQRWDPVYLEPLPTEPEKATTGLDDPHTTE